jgi:hypothetical protein
MKTLIKTAIVGAFALAMTTFGTAKANAGYVYVGYPAYGPCVVAAPVCYPRVVHAGPYCYGRAWYGWHYGWRHGRYSHWR